MIQKILMFNYSLSVYFSRGKKQLINNGAAYLYVQTLFLFLTSLLVFVLFLLRIKILPLNFVLIASIILYYCFYYLKKRIVRKIEEEKYHIKYSASDNKRFYAFLGLSLLIGSYSLFFITACSSNVFTK